MRLTSFRCAAVLYSILSDAGEISSCWARLSRAVANSVAKIHIGAEAGDISGAAAQGASKTQHRCNAILLEKGQSQSSDGSSESQLIVASLTPHSGRALRSCARAADAKRATAAMKVFMLTTVDRMMIVLKVRRKSFRG